MSKNIHEKYRSYCRKLNDILWDVICENLRITEQIPDEICEQVFEKFSPFFKMELSVVGLQTTFQFLVDDDCDSYFDSDVTIINMIDKVDSTNYNKLVYELNDFLSNHYSGYYFDVAYSFCYHSYSREIEIYFFAAHNKMPKKYDDLNEKFKIFARDLVNVDGVRLNYEDFIRKIPFCYDVNNYFSVRIKL